VTVADLSALWVWCDLYEGDLQAVHDAYSGGEAVPARVTVASFPDEVFEGELDLIGSEVDPHTRTLRARVRVENRDGRLRPGMFARVALFLPGDEECLVVPRSAVLRDEQEQFVFQHWRDGLWVRRDVTVRREIGDFAAIEGELPAGAVIATGGAFTLKGDVLREKMGAG
jgi:cobalt-zinc-cadmium efflux system membrane fusion protein